MVGLSQARDLPVIRAGVYSVFTYATLQHTLSVCVLSLTHARFFWVVFTEKRRRQTENWAPAAGWPGVPQGLWLRVWPAECSRSVKTYKRGFESVCVGGPHQWLQKLPESKRGKWMIIFRVWLRVKNVPDGATYWGGWLMEFNPEEPRNNCWLFPLNKGPPIPGQRTGNSPWAAWYWATDADWRSPTFGARTSSEYHIDTYRTGTLTRYL